MCERCAELEKALRWYAESAFTYVYDGITMAEECAKLCDEYADQEWTESGRKEWRDLARKFRSEAK
jgi:hypothetical protein